MGKIGARRCDIEIAEQGLYRVAFSLFATLLIYLMALADYSTFHQKNGALLSGHQRAS